MRRKRLLITLARYTKNLWGNKQMANSRATDDYYEYATVHQEPAGDGYFTNAVGIRQLKGREYIFFSIRDTDISSAGGAGSMRITLQFKCPGDDDWTDYDVYTDVCRKVLEGGAAGVTWRAGVKSDASSGAADQNYTSGEFTFGFDW